MTPSPAGLQLTLEPLKTTSPVLYPEQAADFEIVLTNRTGAAATVLLLSGNLDTPEVVVSDASGRELGRFTEFDLRKRSGSNPEHKEPGPPSVITLDPGLEDRSILSLWRFMNAPGPGRYFVRVEHQATEDGAALISNSVEFEIRPAKIAGMCCGFAAIDRSSAVLAWLAASAANGSARRRLLVRLSSQRDYAKLEMGATNFGEFPAGSHVAVGQAIESTPINGQGWVLATSGYDATLFRHNMAHPLGSVGPIKLPAGDAVAVPGFPDFGRRTVAMATGLAQGRPVLAGFAAQDGHAEPAWAVPLSGAPVLAAAVAQTEKVTYVVYATDNGQASRIFRIGVDPAGKIVDAERPLRASPLAPSALRVVAGRDQPPLFMLLESDRRDASRLNYVRIPIHGDARAFEPHMVEGWPTIPGSDGQPTPAPAAAFDISQDPRGTVYVALTDSSGNLWGGRLDRGLLLLRRANGDPASFPHIVCLRRATTIAAFRSDGRLYFAGGAGLSRPPRGR
jgi:hypothetical protein